MRIVVDSSVVVRWIFREPRALQAVNALGKPCASRLLLVEIGRAIDRMSRTGGIDDEQLAESVQRARAATQALEIVALSDEVLERAAGPFPLTIGSLDAIHLATALNVNESDEGPATLATHDQQLARAARACGLDVIGV